MENENVPLPLTTVTRVAPSQRATAEASPGMVAVKASAGSFVGEGGPSSVARPGAVRSTVTFAATGSDRFPAASATRSSYEWSPSPAGTLNEKLPPPVTGTVVTRTPASNTATATASAGTAPASGTSERFVAAGGGTKPVTPGSAEPGRS